MGLGEWPIIPSVPPDDPVINKLPADFGNGKIGEEPIVISEKNAAAINKVLDKLASTSPEGKYTETVQEHDKILKVSRERGIVGRLGNLVWSISPRKNNFCALRRQLYLARRSLPHNFSARADFSRKVSGIFSIWWLSAVGPKWARRKAKPWTYFPN